MGIITDGDGEDELFDLFMLNEISNGGNTNHSSGGCLSCVLLFLMVPIGVVIGVISVLS